MTLFLLRVLVIALITVTTITLVAIISTWLQRQAKAKRTGYYQNVKWIRQRNPKRLIDFFNTEPKQENAKITVTRTMSEREIEYYKFLQRYVQGKYLVGVNIPLRRFFRCDGFLSKEMYSMMMNGEIDFLILHAISGDVIAAIELDDSTHDTAAGQERDKRKNRLFEMAGLKLHRTRFGNNWTEELDTLLNRERKTEQIN